MSASIFWLAIGAILVLVEVTALPGVGVFFAGLGGITLGGLMTVGIIEKFDYTGQLAMFMLFTGIWWVVLWKPLKNVKNPKGGGYKNLVGTYGVVDDEDGLIPGKIGYVRWSGTRMRARIRPESQVELIENETAIWIYEQKDGVLLVDDKEPKKN